jgi:hypothetical protein
LRPSSGFHSLVVALIGLVWLYHDGEISTSVMFVICYCVKGHGGGGALSVMCVILGCTAQVCLLAAVLCESPAASHNKHRTN